LAAAKKTYLCSFNLCGEEVHLRVWLCPVCAHHWAMEDDIVLFTRTKRSGRVSITHDVVARLV
jgi:hypothetical protein